MEGAVIIFEIFEDGPSDADLGFVVGLGALGVHECDVLEFVS